MGYIFEFISLAYILWTADELDMYLFCSSVSLAYGMITCLDFMLCMDITYNRNKPLERVDDKRITLRIIILLSPWIYSLNSRSGDRESAKSACRMRKERNKNRVSMAKTTYEIRNTKISSH